MKLKIPIKLLIILNFAPQKTTHLLLNVIRTAKWCTNTLIKKT